MSKKKKQGSLFVFEGPDGVGKTTIIKAVRQKLKDYSTKIIALSFPGKQAGTLGRLVYNFHHDISAFNVSDVHPVSLQLLHIAAHIDTISKAIIPLIEEGNIVLLDRYWWSTVVYGKKAGIKEVVLHNMIDIENHFWGNHLPKGVFLLSRTTPLKDELNLDEWNVIKAEYAALKNREEKKYPIFEVFNETTLEEISTFLTLKILEITNDADTT